VKEYVEIIEDYDGCTKEDMIEIINQLADRLNYVLNLIYNSSSIDDIMYDKLCR